jgi:hypothetical protein
MSIKVVRNEAGNCITFENSTVPTYFNACLSAQAEGDTVKVKNDIRSKELGREFNEFSNVPYQEFRDANGDSFASAQEAADYITLNGNVAAPADINVGYKGSYDASTGLLPNYPSPVAGDWFYIGNSGDISGTTYEVNDIIKYNETNSTWERLANNSARLSQIEDSALTQYDIHVDSSYTGQTRTGSSLQPYTSLEIAVANSVPGNSILIKGTQVLNSEVVLPHSLSFYGASNASVKYSTYNTSNGDLLSFNGTGVETFEFFDIAFSNAGDYGLYIRNVLSTVIKDCTFKNNGWDGTGLNTVVSETVSGVLGYDSSSTDLQAFYASSNASNGGAVRIQDSAAVELIGNVVTENLRGLRVQDCGIGGFGYVTRNQCSNNIESGIYLASSAYNATGGCENFTVYNNASSYNANNGILSVGGINNVISLNIIRGNWNAGVMAWHASNTIVRDLDLSNNNRSAYNGIGNTGDAHSSITIAGNTARADRDYLVSVLGTEVYNTGLGSNTSRIGLQILENVQEITDDYSRTLINLDDIGFQSQDYAIDCLADLATVKLTVGDCRYIDTAEKNINIVSGSYYELPFSNHVTSLKYADFSQDGEAIIIKEGTIGARLNPYSVYDLKAVEGSTGIDIVFIGSDKVQFTLDPANVSIDGTALTGTVPEKVNTLNALLQASGSPVGNAPVITSSLAINLTEGDTLNYELVATDGVGYEWDLSNVPGVVNVEGNMRKLIGGSSLAVGEYAIPVKAVNLVGEDSQIVEVSVGSPPFTSSKSINFSNQDWMGANASLLDATLGRASNGSGSADAWSMSFYFKPSTEVQGQTIFYFGDNDANNGGYIQVMQLNNGGNKALRIRYGSNNNCLRMQTLFGSITAGTWHHVLITYDGGTTGSSSASMSTYYSRFKIFVDGVEQTRSDSHVNYGYTGGVDPDNLRVGRHVSGNYMRGCRMSELAVWNSDQSSNVSTLYNSGAPFDLGTLSTEPKHWWRMGDGDTYPYVFDVGTEANCIFVMNNMTAADIVTDAP